MQATINHPKILPAFLICIVIAMGRGTSVAQTTSPANNAATPSDAQKVFDNMKALAGSWQGPAVQEHLRWRRSR